MSLAFCVLGSGSSGNCTLIAMRSGSDRRFMLIDAGLSPRATARRLGAIGVSLANVSDILVTHLDRDHLHVGWFRALRSYPITLRVHQSHAPGLAPGLAPFHLNGSLAPFDGSIALGGRAHVDAIHCPHDACGTIGFVIEHERARLGFATDLGRVPRTLLGRFTDLDAVAIESNYDPPMQLASARPGFLKRRIMGGRGHLSNEQALEAVLEIDRRSRLRHVALLHLSRHCNHPRIVRSMYESRAPHLLDRLTITSQTHASPLLHVQAGGPRQMSLFDGVTAGA